MKVKVPRRSNYRDSNDGFIPPPIPFERPAARELEKDQYLALKLKSVPGSATSLEYTLNVPYFQSGMGGEWIKFLENLERVFVGQDLQSGPNKFSMTRRLLAGDSLSHFNNHAVSLVEKEGVPNKTEDTFKACIRAVTKTIMGKKALLTQKRYMRRILRKPKRYPSGSTLLGSLNLTSTWNPFLHTRAALSVFHQTKSWNT